MNSMSTADTLNEQSSHSTFNAASLQQGEGYRYNLYFNIESSSRFAIISPLSLLKRPHLEADEDEFTWSM